jgi:hypothetical protein
MVDLGQKKVDACLPFFMHFNYLKDPSSLLISQNILFIKALKSPYNQHFISL